MRQAFVGGGAFDRPADQRRGRAGVLMVRIPGAKGETARAKDVLAEIDVSRIQGGGSLHPSAERSWRDAFCA
jgi:hypothetical protein